MFQCSWLRRSPSAAVCLWLLLSLAGCGSDGGVGPDDNPPGDHIYVDPAYTGVEEGTQEHPYNTIEEGIAAAGRGDTVVLAAGTYAGREDIGVPRVVTILGAGADASIVSARFLVSAPEDSLAVFFKRLTCEGVTFQGNLRPGQDVSDQSEFLPRVEYAPIEVDSCDVSYVGIGYPPNHSFTIENSEVDSIKFNQGASDHGTHTVSDCSIAGSVRFQHGAGSVTATVERCTIGGTIQISTGSGHAFTIADNTVNGIHDVSGACFTTISGNVLPSGDLRDSSGGSGTESEVIEWNEVMNGVIFINSGSATCRYNTVSAPADTIGITMDCGAPANLVGNTVTLPYGGEPVGEPWEWRQGIGIRASCGPGVIQGNTVTGGSVGILDRSGATELSGNVVSGAYYGIFAAYGLSKDVTDNSVTDCVSDGIVISNSSMPGSLYGAFENNTIIGNGGAGIRMQRPADLGGGAHGSVGGNAITGNGGYDLCVEVPAGSAAVIFAEGNVWDHTTEGEVHANDIWDANDDPSLSAADVAPLGTRPAGLGETGQGLCDAKPN